MKEYIERAEIKSALQPVTHDSSCPLHIAAAVDQVLDCIPAADVVEVVRCRNCKHYKPQEYFSPCVLPQGIECAKPDDFCSYGQRKEAEHEVS